MKKQYIIPEIKVVMLNTACNMLAGSELGYQGDFNSEKVNIASRRGSIWDDDEEDY